MPKIELNRHIYLFTAHQTARKTVVVIYAHGEQILDRSGNQKVFKPSSERFNGSIFFYCPEDRSLVSNPQQFFEDFVNKNPHESYGPNQDVPNYDLTKAVGYHLRPTQPRTPIQLMNLAQAGDDPMLLAAAGQFEYGWMQEMANRHQYDVAMIRNPTAFNSYSLKAAVGALRQYSGIGDIHCHFCRVKAINAADPAFNHNINANLPPGPPPA